MRHRYEGPDERADGEAEGSCIRNSQTHREVVCCLHRRCQLLRQRGEREPSGCHRPAQKIDCGCLGEEKCLDPIITSGGDDFHFYTVKYPELKGAMLGLGCGLKPGLHHPYMTFDHTALINGTDILYQAILNVE